MKIEMYINDTLHERPPMGHIEANVNAWGKISKKRMKKYCENYDIKLSYHNEEDSYHGILDSFYYKFYQDELLRFRSNEWYQSLSGFTYWCCATLKKIVRWYRFAESDNDTALFVDLDILPLKFVDIRDYIKPDQLGISYAPKNASNRVYGWYDENWYDNQWLMASAKHLSTKNNNIIQSSSMAIVNKEHAIKMLKILEKEKLNPLTEAGYKNIIEFSRNSPPSVAEVEDYVGLPYDELLLNMAMNSDEFTKPQAKAGHVGVDTSDNPSIYNLNKDLLFDICFQQVFSPDHAAEIVDVHDMPFCHFGGAPAKQYIQHLDELYPYE
tara:strand:- start:5641 stop:6615 length:975 start_codon:yes stop_codon:yes gene_type:complete